MSPLRTNAVKTPWRRRLGSMVFGLLVVSACSSESPPSKGNIGVVFPSTAAAVATDYLQFFIFDPPASADRATVCQDLIQARKKGDYPSPAAQSPLIHVCEALEGVVPVTVPYGEHAVLVIGLRNSKDFLVGCTLQTYGEGDAVLPIALSLIDASSSLPSKTCPTLSAFCSETCKPN